MADSVAPMASLGFGCGDLYGGERGAASRALIEAAWDAGIRHFDTARLYGDGSAEGVLGEALGSRRDQATIVTKAGIVPWSMRLGARMAGKAARLARKAGPLATLVPQPPEASARFGAFETHELRRSVDASLKALRTDRLDVLLLHECSPADACRPEMLSFLEGLRAHGKIADFGIAARFPETLQIIAQCPAVARTAQFASDAANGNIDEVRGAGPARIITHTPLKEALPALMTRLRGDSDAHRWREATGLEADDRQGAAALLLAAAAARNPGGVVLFSTSRPERIQAAVEAVREPPSPAAVRVLENLLHRTPSETFQDA